MNIKMEINKITNTCSMIELGNLDKYSIKGLTFKQFRGVVNKKLRSQNMKDLDDKNYSILYNCANTDLPKYLKRLGFKHVFTYIGQGNPVKVFILEFDRRNWFQRWFNS